MGPYPNKIKLGIAIKIQFVKMCDVNWTKKRQNQTDTKTCPDFKDKSLQNREV